MMIPHIRNDTWKTTSNAFSLKLISFSLPANHRHAKIEKALINHSEFAPGLRAGGLIRQKPLWVVNGHPARDRGRLCGLRGFRSLSSFSGSFGGQSAANRRMRQMSGRRRQARISPGIARATGTDQNIIGPSPCAFDPGDIESRLLPRHPWL